METSAKKASAETAHIGESKETFTKIEGNDEELFHQAIDFYSKKEYDKAKKLIDILAKRKDDPYPPAQYTMGFFLSWGIGGGIDVDLSERICRKTGKEALNYFEKFSELATSQGKHDGFADYAIGRILGCRHGVEPDYEKAIKHYQRSAEQNNPNAICNLGWMHENGFGVQKSVKKALEYYQRSAELGSPIANYNCGVILERNYPDEGMVKDKRQAFRYFKEASKLGSPDGMASCGIYYLQGDVVTPDIDYALLYLTESGRKGCALAYTILGGIYLDGEDDVIKPNSELALHYFKLGARLGDPDCLADLALCCADTANDCIFQKRNEKERLQMFAAAQSFVNEYVCVSDAKEVPVDEGIIQLLGCLLEDGKITEESSYVAEKADDYSAFFQEEVMGLDRLGGDE